MFYGILDIGRNALRLSSNSDQLRADEFWAVDDVSFEIKKGEILGLIGPNGAGKTTLLKMIHGIFGPDKGKISVWGRVGALISVGVGFHPLLTGRENIYLGAAIMGMTKMAVARKFDAIVDFADIGDFLDTPVKNYSSGMFVRLGFSVAIHCEPDLLLVDEALAVGDTAFRRKSLERMKKFMQSGDKTILYVSHHMESVIAISHKVVLLNRGKIVSMGDPAKVITDHDLLMRPGSKIGDLPTPVIHHDRLQLVKKFDGAAGDEVVVTAVWLESLTGECRKEFSADEDTAVCFTYENRSTEKITKSFLWIAFHNEFDVSCSGTLLRLGEQQLPEELPESGTFRVWFRPLQLTTSTYRLSIGIFDETFTIPFVYEQYGDLIALKKNRTNQTPGIITPLCWPKCDCELIPTLSSMNYKKLT